MANNGKKFYHTAKGKWSMSILALIMTIGGVLTVGKTWFIEPIVKDIYEKELKKQIDIRIGEIIQMNPVINSIGQIQQDVGNIKIKQEEMLKEFQELNLYLARKGI